MTNQKIIKRVSFLLVLLIIFNFLILDCNPHVVNAEAITISYLSLKLLAVILAAMGVYLANTTDYEALYFAFQESGANCAANLKQFTVSMRDYIINRKIIDISGIYENLKDFINNLDFTSGSYKNITIGGQMGPSQNIGSYSLGTALVANVPFNIGHNVLKAVYNSSGYVQVLDYIGNGKWSSFHDSYLKDMSKIKFDYAYDQDCFPTNESGFFAEIYEDTTPSGNLVRYYTSEPYPEVDTIPGTIEGGRNISIKKSKNVVDVRDKEIAVPLTGNVSKTWDTLPEAVQDLDSEFTDFIPRLYEWWSSEGDVLIPDGQVLKVSENNYTGDIPAIPDLPGATDIPVNPDIPLNPDIPVNPDIPLDPSIPFNPALPFDPSLPFDDTLPVDDVIDEPIPADTNVLGLGLITKLLKYIAGLLKTIIVSPLKFLKTVTLGIWNAVKLIPALLTQAIGYVADIPNKLIQVIEGIQVIPQWLQDILTGILAIPTHIPNILQGLRDIPGGIVNGLENVVTHIIAIPGALSEQIELNTDKWFKSTKELDFSPLQVTILKEKFPFSIPFDLFNIFNQLNKSPQVPKWNINIKGVDLELDFAIFEGLASIARWAVFIIFVIGLLKFYGTFLL